MRAGQRAIGAKRLRSSVLAVIVLAVSVLAGSMLAGSMLAGQRTRGATHSRSSELAGTGSRDNVLAVRRACLATC